MTGTRLTSNGWSITIGSRDDWIATGLSDHAPLILDVDSGFASDV